MLNTAKCLANCLKWLLAAILCSSFAFASDRQDITAQSSSLEFSVQILGVLKKRGHFGEFNGHLKRQSGAANTAAVYLTIRSDSAVMRSKKDTEMVKGEDFFASAKFPEVRFESAAFDAGLLLDTQALHAISGHLSLRGKRLPETLTLKVLSCDKLDALEKCSFQVTGELGRARYGMQSHRAFVGDDVRLTLVIKGLLP